MRPRWEMKSKSPRSPETMLVQKVKNSVKIKGHICQKLGNFDFQSKNCFCSSLRLEISFQSRYYCSEIVLRISKHYVQLLRKYNQTGYSSNRASR